MNTFDKLNEAKAKRDLTRGLIVAALRKGVDLPADLLALLRADELATQEFQAAVVEHCSTTEEGA